MKLPYFHIVDVEDERTTVHILLFRHRKILTLAKSNGNWHITGVVPEDQVANVVQSHHLHTGHLHKLASRSKMSQAARVLGIKASKLPKLTNANADVIINSESIHKDLHQIRDLAQRKEVELGN